MGFDQAWGTDTARFDLDNYEPILPSVFDEAMDGLDIDVTTHTFVDLGSGKGRAVMLASRRPFLRCVGIEHSDALHRTAVANLTAFAARGGSVAPMFSFLGDALEHPLPAGPLVVYQFNPFATDDQLRMTRRLVGRPLRLVMVNPIEEAVVEAAGLVETRRGGEGDIRRWRVFRNP